MSQAKLWKVKELAEVYGVNPITVYRWIKDGKVQAFRVGRGSYRIHAHVARALIEGLELPES